MYSCKRSQKRLRTYKIEPTLPELAKIRKIRRMFSAIHGDASSYSLRFNAALPHALVRCICFLSKVDAPFPAWADSAKPSTIEAFFFFFTVHSFHGAPVGPRLSLGAPPGLPLNVNASGARWSSASVMFKRANLIVASMVKASDPYPILEVRHLLL